MACSRVTFTFTLQPDVAETCSNICCDVTVFIADSVLLVVENIRTVQVSFRKFYKSEPPPSPRSRPKWDIVRLERVAAVMHQPSPSVRRSLQLLRVCGTHLYAHGSTIVGFYHGLTRITNGTAAGTNRTPHKLKNTAPVHYVHRSGSWQMNMPSRLVKQSHYRPWGFQEVEAPRFQDNRHIKVVKLSALRTGRLYPPGNIPGTHFC